MKAKLLNLLVILCFGLPGAISLLPAKPVLASATAAMTVGCSTVTATGTTNQPYVRLAVRNDDFSFYQWQFFPVSGGTFSVTMSFPEQPGGTILWATTRGSADGINWDSEAYTEVNSTFCEVAPVVPTVTGINDERLCLWDDYAIYTDSDSIDVYGIEASQGYLVASVDQQALDTHPGTPDSNTLISEQGRILFYRLGDSDTYQVHVGPNMPGISKYVRFTGLPAENVFCGVVQ